MRRAGVRQTLVTGLAAERGRECGGPHGVTTVEPPKPAASGKVGVTAVPAATPVEKLLHSRPASVCRGGGGWAGARLLFREGREPRCVRGRSTPSAPFSRPELVLAQKIKTLRGFSSPATKFCALLGCMCKLGHNKEKNFKK